MLEAKHVSLFGATTRRVKKLYEAAFPVEQRIPFWALRLRAGMNGMEIVSYSDEGTFCGFSCQVVTDDLVYIYYLAVDPELRGRGYGGQILELLKQSHPGMPVALDIESRKRNADNAKPREARRKFYLDNGFKPTGYGFKDGDLFEILICGEKPENPVRYAVAIDRLAFGLTHTMIRPMSELREAKKH